MEDAIKKKLRRELSRKSALTEKAVVYILAEIRKLLERRDEKEKYYALNFHCSWALHTTMDRGPGTVRILERFDQAFQLLQDKDLHELPGTLSKELEATVGMKKFRASLKSFLIDHGLPTRIVDEHWTQFLRQYAAVIEDCALTIKDEAANLRNINEVTVHKDDAKQNIEGAGQTFKAFRIRWVSHGKNGKKGTIAVYHTIP
jgi:hypothetical protein